VGRRPDTIKAGNVSGGNLKTEGSFTIPLGVSFGNHCFYDEKDHSFEVIKTLAECDALIHAWYQEMHKVGGTTISHLHFPHCRSEWYGHGQLHLEY
jgi:hypothetical protein